ncbi:MAG: diaminopimelate epimerase [Rhodoblastus sp.]
MKIEQDQSLGGRRATKMNGAGNEILMLDLRGSAARVTPDDAKKIGAAEGLHYDQLMVLYDPARADAAAAMKIFNIDGSLSGACGNGARCVAWALLRDNADRRLLLESDGGLLCVTRQADGRLTVDMGPPKLDWRAIPLAGAGENTERVALTPAVPGAPGEFCAVSMGNPHAVFFVPDAYAVDLAALGPQIENHPLFPERANISFAQIRTRDSLVLRVWERGAGATLACGTAACATAVAGVRLGLTARIVTLALPGGDLRIEWRASDGHVLMQGPVELEFETKLDAAIFAQPGA